FLCRRISYRRGNRHTSNSGAGGHEAARGFLAKSRQSLRRCNIYHLPRRYRRRTRVTSGKFLTTYVAFVRYVPSYVSVVVERPSFLKVNSSHTINSESEKG